MPTKIEWVKNPDGTPGMTWNPVTGCTTVSPGCARCYAKRMAMRFTKHFNVTCHPDRLEQPLHWKKPRTCFVCSMADLFHEKVPFDFIDKVFAVMTFAPQHTFLLLTKRQARMAKYADAMDAPPRVRESYMWLLEQRIATPKQADAASALNVQHGRPGFVEPWPLPNVWLGVTAEDQQRFDERISFLRKTPAAVRFVSLEPLLSSIAFLPQDQIDWVIVGPETGPGARPMNLDWARSIRDQCQAAGVPFFYKRGELDGRIHHEMPEVTR